jgi:hypothetical protein
VERWKVKLKDTIQAYHGAAGEHHRYRSWEHCYGYFRRSGPRGLQANPEDAALQLAFYLASWGMYRGSSFLLQFAYTVHLPALRVIGSDRFVELWGIDLGSDAAHEERIPLVLGLIDEIREAYQPYAIENRSKPATDTLVTKVILGTFGCVPACDEFFTRGLKEGGIPYSSVNRPFLRRMLEFCRANLRALHSEQARIGKVSGVPYPLMKLVDMHFWQWGAMLRARDA